MGWMRAQRWGCPKKILEKLRVKGFLLAHVNDGNDMEVHETHQFFLGRGCFRRLGESDISPF